MIPAARKVPSPPAPNVQEQDFPLPVYVIAGAYLLFDAYVVLRYIGCKLYQTYDEDGEDYYDEDN